MPLNIGIAAHIDAGKTTLSERILFYSGVIHKIGEVHEGSATMDYLEEEKKRGVTITSAVTSFKWKGAHVNLIDTPGHVDFTIEVERCMRVLDGAIIVLCGVGGVEPQTETVWRQINRYKIPRLIFINKLDRAGADFERVIKAIEKKLKIIPLKITYPFEDKGELRGVVDIIEEKLIFFEGENGERVEVSDIPESEYENAKKIKEELIEKVAEVDDDIMEKFIEGKTIHTDELKSAIKRACLSLRVVPVYCGSALKNKGVQPLLDGAITFLPFSDEIKHLRGFNRKTGEKELIEKPEKTLVAYIFKSQIVNGRKICFTRIYSGELKKGQEVINLTNEKSQRISKIYRIHADKRKEIETAREGDIVGILIKEGNTGDTLTDKKDYPYRLENIEIYNPVISFAIEPYSLREMNDLIKALKEISEEDPSFRYSYNEETNQLIISGMGEFHLEIITNRLFKNYGLRIKTGKPQVLYRETITKKALSEFEYNLKVEDETMYAYVSLSISPKNRTGKDNSNTIEFSSDIQDIPERAIEGVKEGLTEAFISGELTGSEIIDTYVKVISISDKTGKFEKGAFKVASINAFKDAYSKANPVKLEPVMELVVIVPDEFTGDVIGDLNSRGAKVLSISKEENSTVIKAHTYLSKLFGYATSLRTLTKGKGEFTMTFYRYDSLQ